MQISKIKKQALMNLQSNKDFKELIYGFIYETRDIALDNNVDDEKVRDELKARAILKKYLDDINDIID